jgi:hypothetical protein
MILVATDPHFNDKPEDKHRFKLFGWLTEQAKKYQVSAVLILGDLTDAKDRHSAELVHKISNGVMKIANQCPIHVLKGNHDYLDPMYPFFRFLDHLPNVNYYDEPKIAKIAGWDQVFLPHHPEPAKHWGMVMPPLRRPPVVYMHQTVEGAVAESGETLHGISPHFFGPHIAVWSGDIHVPQRIGPVNYVGTPYRIRYGDKFRGRCVLLNYGGELQKTLHFPCPNKHLVVVRSAHDIRINKLLLEGDWVKVRVSLGRDQFSEWEKRKRNIRKVCEERGLHIKSIELVEAPYENSVPRLGKLSLAPKPVAIYDSYVKARKLDGYIEKVGREIVEEGVDGER